MKRSGVLAVLSISLSLAGWSATGQAQEAPKQFPAKPVRIVVPFAAGGALDVVGRLVADRLSPLWKQPILIDNRPGASGSVGAQYVAGSPPDGHTILFASTGMLQAAILYPALRIDPFNDFTPISRIVKAGVAFVVGPQAPVSTMAQYISLIRSRPAQFSYASFGAGTTSHIYGELLRSMEKLDLTHVAYRGEAVALIDVSGGSVTGGFVSTTSAASAAKGGRVKALAVTGTGRSNALQGVPTFQEIGLRGFESVGWFGWFAPSATPKALVEQIARDVNDALADPDVIRRIEAAGLDVVGSTPDEFAKVMRTDFDRWNFLINQLAIKVE